MMWRNNNLSPHDKATKRIWAACVLLVTGIATCLWAGTSVRTSFPLANDGVADSNMTATAGGIGLAVEREAFIKLLGDSFPSFPSPSLYSDVGVVGVDSFSFFCVHPTQRNVVYQDVQSLPSGNAVLGRSGIFCEINPLPTTDAFYLHVDKGNGGWCASYVKSSASILELSTGAGYLNADTADADKWLFSSQCSFSGDTFLVVNNVSLDTVWLRKVYARGGTITVVAEAVAATGTNDLLNCTVGADENGTILVAWTTGNPGGTKYLQYRFFGADLTPGPAGSYAQPVCEATFYYYDDVAIASYGSERFALVSWDQTGILLHRLQLVGNSITASTSRIINGPGFKFCTVAANTDYMMIATRGDLDGNGTAGIEGLVYKMTNYVPGTPDTIAFSIPAVTVQVPNDSTYSSALNSAVDDSGTFALTWRNGQKTGGCIWSLRDIRYPHGFYTSPVESLATGGDSIRFSPAEVTLSSTASWYTVDSLRTGSSASACATAPWRSFSDAAALDAAPTTDRYFQYRTSLRRTGGGTIDSLTTPDITSITVPWNLQPSIDGIDSITVGTVVHRGVSFGDTVTMISRYDSARIALSAHDRDNGETVSTAFTLPTTPATSTLSGGPGFTPTLTVLPYAVSDTVLTCTMTISDDDSWEGVGRRVYLRSRNSPPELLVRALVREGGGVNDTMICSGDTSVLVQVEDTVEIIYEVADSNDAATVLAYVAIDTGSAPVRIDSTDTDAPAVFTLRADTATPASATRFIVTTEDPDTTVTQLFDVVVNHPPRLSMVTSGGDTLYDGDTLNVVLYDTSRIEITMNDTDLAFGDTVVCTTRGVRYPDSVRSASSRCILSVIPDDRDTMVWIAVRDRSSRKDSLHINLAYPWYAVDSSENPGYVEAKNRLSGGVSLIAGSSYGDTVAVPLINTGRDVLRLTGYSFPGVRPAWLQTRIISADTTVIADYSGGQLAVPVTVEAGDSAEVRFIFTTAASVGDTVECIEFVLFTNDSRVRSDTFPVCLEYNDLPRIVSVNPHFVADQPYRRVAKRAAYVFPPHATVSVGFSEPMDSASAVDGLTLYSAFDAWESQRITPIPLRYEWLQGYTTVHLSPHYSTASPAYGVLPPAGLFIPTDSLVLVVSSTLHDRATTPSGPNALDVDRNNRRDTATDTSFGMRVDRIDFTVATIDPQPDDTAVERRPQITLTFSSPVYAASVDTALRTNRSLSITSRYAGGDTLTLRSVRIDSTRVVFTGARELFYRDSLYCSYSSRWILDRMGFATDNSGDGIDATLFDSLSPEDNLQWGYRIKPIAVSSVTPDSASVIDDVSPIVTVTFTDRLTPGIIDTDTSSNNRSFKMGSLRTGWTSFSRIRIADDSMSVELRPRAAFFSNDSVFCSFTGFNADYRYARNSNLPDPTGPLFGGYEWSFESGEIGFYTYPNPYKPGTDPRHCDDGGPCGIWFKNLHTLRNGISEVAIAVFSQTAHPVFDSRKAGRTIRFGTGADDGLPQWLWNTRNNRGELVATGLYLYAVYDLSGKVLQRGKLIIVR